MRSSKQEIDRLAAEWATRVESGCLPPEDEARLEAWLAADTRHLGAFGKAIAVLARLDRLRAVGPEAVYGEVRGQSTAWSRRGLLFAGSGLAAAGIAAAVLLKSPHQPPAPIKAAPVARPESYATRIGETRLVALSDGSVVTLNTNSRIVVHFAKAVRRIQLERGEALFNVAKNKQRPFVVTAGDTQVRAVGTAFTVRLLQKQPIQILVQEGVVEVTRKGSSDVTPVRAVADTRTVVASGAPIANHPVTYTQVSRDLAWQYGQIAFDNQTLEEAAREFARYSKVKIIVDPAVANRTITGLFASNDPAGFAEAAASALSLRTETGVEEVRIIR